MRCPYLSWPDATKGCKAEATVRLHEVPAEGDETGRKGMTTAVCPEHKSLYLAAGWHPR